jgi:hypothetical protein
MLNDHTSPTEQLATEPDPVKLDQRSVRQVDDLEGFINRLVAEVGHRWEAIADRTFDTLFDGDVSAALAGRQMATPKYEALASRAGVSLDIGQSELSRAVRIGAINHRLPRSDWSKLSWSVKVELLPLLGAEQDFALLEKGVKAATSGPFGQREARQWVADQRTEPGDEAPRTPKLTPVKAGKVFEFTAALRKVAGRRELSDKVRALDEEAHKAFMAALADALRNLGKLQQELLTQDDDAE